MTSESIEKHLKSINPKKAKGYDNIPPKILKCSANIICKPTSNIVNNMINTTLFPDSLKMAQVTPVFKKDDPFIMKNYRPVSILPSMSKFFEKIVNEQLSNHFENIFHSYLVAFGPGYGCQSTLLHLVED